MSITPRGIFSELRDNVRLDVQLAPGQTLRLQLDPKASMSVHCVEGVVRRQIESNLPETPVRADGCDK